MTLYVDAYAQYRISVSEWAHFKAVDVLRLVKFMTQGTMKTVFCEHTLAELLSNRKTIEKKISEQYNLRK